MLLSLLIACNPTETPETVEGDTAPPDDTVVDTDTDTDDTDDTDPPDTDPPSDSDAFDDRPRVVILIGDGMGAPQRDAASLFAHGDTGKLFLQQLPHSSPVVTTSLNGVTDSAASATAMATGAVTWNGVVGLDRDVNTVQNLVELAKSLGMATGVVTTAEVTHATPAAFTAHNTDRNNGAEIAEDQVALLPDVVLGGGARYYLPKGKESSRDDGGLIKPLEKAGCAVVYSRDELQSADAGGCLFGLFGPSHLDYMFDRPKDTTQPSLTEMTEVALDRLFDHEGGFLLMVEGARIDMAGHSNELERMIAELLEFDATVELVSDRLSDVDQSLLIVTADHETGGLTVREGQGIGKYPAVSWRHREHSNSRILMYAQGDGAEIFDGTERHHPWLHAAVSAYIEDRDPVTPTIPMLPDGHLSDHRWRVVEQTLTTDFGEGFNQLDGLTLDVSPDGLYVGVEGLVEWENNALVVLIDHDPGAGTGTATLSDVFSDYNGGLETVLSNIDLLGPSVEGFGADLAVVAVGGRFSQAFAQLQDMAGVRGTSEAYGAPYDLWWLTAGISFADDVRIEGTAGTTVSERGIEAFVPWDSLYPELKLKGNVPVDAAVSLAAVLVNSDGTTLSNQALPPYAGEPDGSHTLAGVVHFVLDTDSDGVADGDIAPEVLWK